MKLSQNEIQIWYVNDAEAQDPYLLKRYISILNEEEQLQYRHFHFHKHRHQYLITRALVRSVLSLYHDHIQPETWRFTKNHFGKPSVLNSSALSFNISHSNGIIIMAVAHQKNLGIDIETISRDINLMEMAEQCFSSREIALLQATHVKLQHRCFFSLWTLKEAYVKACGIGLTIPLNELCFAGSGINNIQLNKDSKELKQECQFWQIHPDINHIVSLAVKAAHPNLVLSIHKMIPFSFITKMQFPITRDLHDGYTREGLNAKEPL